MNRVIIKYCHALFVFKTQNCLENFTTIITALSIVFWFDDSGVCLSFNQNYCIVCSEITFNEDLCLVETSQLIELMPVLFFLYLTCRLITVKECAELFRFKNAS